MTWLGALCMTVVALGLGTPVPAQELNSSEMTGSVLVFPKFLAGTVAVGETAAGAPIVESRSSFNISVACPSADICPAGASVKLLGRWVCPGSQDPRSKSICKAANFELITTVNGTLTFNPENLGTRSAVRSASLNVPKPPCPEGFLIVWVVSPSNASAPSAIKFDGLAGNAVLRNSTHSAGSYTAIPIQAASHLQTGAFTDVNRDGNLDFDGSEYKAVTGQLAGPIRFPRSTKVQGTTLGRIDTVLTLLTLDVKAGRPNPATVVDFHFFNESEELISASHEFICWTEVKLTSIDANLDEFFGTGGHHGLFTTTVAETFGFGFSAASRPVTLLGIAETIERNRGGVAIREHEYTLFNNGRPVPTTFDP
jgi:hypothetical protein